LLARTASDEKEAEQERVNERAGWLQLKLNDVAEYRLARTKGRTLSSAIDAEINKAARVSESIAGGFLDSPEPGFASELLPAEGLLTSLISAIGAKPLSSTPIGESSVWEDSPVAGARPLPPHKDLTDKYVAEMETIRGSELSPKTKIEADKLGLSGFFAEWGQVTQPARLRLEVRPEETMTVVSLAGYDASGKQILTATLIAQPVKVWRRPEIIVKDNLLRGDATWLPLTPQSAAPLSLSAQELIAKPPAWFLKPENNEPLDLFVGDALRAMAKKVPTKCMAVQVVDGVWDDAQASIVKGRLNAQAFESMLKEWTRYERLETADYVVWRPKGTIDPARCQADRKAMGSFTQAVIRNKALDLRTLAKFRESSGPVQTSLTLYWSRTLRWDPQTSLSGDTTHTFYRLIGSISDTEWQRLAMGRVLTVGDLGLSGRFASLLDEDRTPIQSAMPFPAVLRHPRESFPSGDIQKAPVRVIRRRRELLGTVSSQGDGIIQWSEGIPALSILTVRNDPEKGPVYSMTRDEYERWLKALKFRTGIQDETAVVIQLPGGTFEVASFADPLIPTSALSTYDGLQSSVRDAIWLKAKESATPAGGKKPS
jgi:hypothetical protein